MAHYSVFFDVYERWWYRYDVEASSPEEACSVAQQFWDDGADPDKEIYDQLIGPLSAEVEDETGKTVYSKLWEEKP